MVHYSEYKPDKKKTKNNDDIIILNIAIIKVEIDLNLYLFNACIILNPKFCINGMQIGIIKNKAT